MCNLHSASSKLLCSEGKLNLGTQGRGQIHFWHKTAYFGLQRATQKSLLRGWHQNSSPKHQPPYHPPDNSASLLKGWWWASVLSPAQSALGRCLRLLHFCCWALFNGDRVSDEQLCCCYHFAAPFRLPLEATVQPAHATVPLLLWCRTEVFELAQTQVPFSMVEISYEFCTTAARQVLAPRWVWKPTCSWAQLWWPPKNTPYLLPHAVFCLRHLSQIDLCSC